MCAKINFTKAALEQLLPKSKLYDVKDVRTPGLFIRINPTGVKSFHLFRRIGGRLARVPIGRFGDITVDAARKQATFLNGQIVTGIRPHEILREKRAELTFAKLFDKYYVEHALKNTKRPEDIRATIAFHVLPKLGSYRVGDITKSKLKEIYHAQGENSGKTQANKVLDLIRAIFNFGIREEYFKGPNPTLGITRFKRRFKDRFLLPKELKLFFDAIKTEEQIYQDFFMLSVLIGARKTTMLTMRYSEIDYDLKRWRRCEDESKNDDVNIFVLSDTSVEILKRREIENKNSVSPSSWVFPGRGEAGHLVDPKKAFNRIKDKMGIQDITMHDLRRTLGSYMAMNNDSLTIIAGALNHKSTASTEIYARLSNEPIRDAVDKANRSILERANLLPATTNQYNVLAVQPIVKYC